MWIEIIYVQHVFFLFWDFDFLGRFLGMILGTFLEELWGCFRWCFIQSLKFLGMLFRQLLRDLLSGLSKGRFVFQNLFDCLSCISSAVDCYRSLSIFAGEAQNLTCSCKKKKSKLRYFFSLISKFLTSFLTN